MKKAILVAWFLALVCVPVALAGPPGRFMTYPDIRGDAIVFSFEGDIWSVTAAGGVAHRLTSHPGNEYGPKLSPDGKWVAFTGSYDGGAQVYVIPAGGGVPKRVTYTTSEMVGWTPGGKIVLRTGQEATFRPIVKLFTVTPEGTLPEPLPIERATLCSYSPDGKRLAYNRRGNEEYYWKRYKGGQYTDIWLYDFTTKQFTPLTDYVGKNAYPMWIGNRIFFVSDRGQNGIANLWAYDLATKKTEQVTRYLEFDVQMPSTDGQRIVFLDAGRVHVYDPSNGSIREVPIEVTSDRWQLADRTVNPRDYIHSMSVANDGRTAVFEARGDVYLVAADGASLPRNLTNTAGTRERYPQLSPDGKRVAFFSDKTGDYQLYVADATGDKPWEALTTTLDRTAYHLEWSPDGSKILFGNKDFALFYVDVATKKLVKVASSNQLKNDEFYWEVSDYGWSPDSRWIAYSFVQFNRNNQVFIYSIDQNKSIPVTDGFYDSLNPSFDANGEYLYFLSYRNFATRIDIFEDNHVIETPVQVMAVQLKAGLRPPFERGTGDRKAESGPFRIDVAGLERRVYPLPVPAGDYRFLKAGKGYVTWASTPQFGETEIEEIFSPSGEDKWTLHIFDVGAQKDVQLEPTISDWRLSASREQVLSKKGNTYFVSTIEKIVKQPKSPGDRLDLDRMAYRVKPLDEWTQIFNDTWRWYRDFFYDANMHGHDWKKIGDSYRALLPEMSSRADLNWLLSQMVGELCVSHTYISGGDPGPARLPDNQVFTGLLGADLRTDSSGYPRLTRIYGPTAYNADLTSPLVRPDVDVKEGDFLVAIEGHDLKGENPYRLLQVTRGQRVRIAVNSTPSPAGARTYEIEPLRSDGALRYNRWMSDNVDGVLKASSGDVGYMHITAMSTDNVGQFDKFWRAFRYKKGLVIDVRGNGGGWTEYFLIDKLERQMVAYNVLRNIEPFRYPGSTSTAHLVVLTNEYNGSDGEAFLEDFKARKLGTIIGVPSWGGLVGIVNGQRTIDNGTVQQSNNSFYGRSGSWWVENHGVDPDILLDNDPTSATAGRDLQLERALEVLGKQIRDNPFTFPPLPKYPVR